MVAVMGQRHPAGRFGIMSASSHSFGGDCIARWLVLYTQGTYVVLVHVVEVAGAGGLGHGVRKHRGGGSRCRHRIRVGGDGSGGWAGAGTSLLLLVVFVVLVVVLVVQGVHCFFCACVWVDRSIEYEIESMCG